MVCCDFVCLEEFRGGLLLIWVFVEDLSVKVGAFFFLLFWIKSLVGVASWSVDKIGALLIQSLVVYGMFAGLADFSGGLGDKEGPKL